MARSSQFCTFYLDKLLFGVELKGVQEVIRSLDMTKIPMATAISVVAPMVRFIKRVSKFKLS